MLTEDRIYGGIEISDPVIREIIDCQAFQRLKAVNQYGGVNFVYPGQYQVSRFEHSVGVWHVLQKFGASLEIQVAGLLHDIGHTAFSHMVDMAIGGASEDFHERHLHLIPGWEDLQQILRTHRIEVHPLEHYPEIKTSLPSVGADRFDYAIRDWVGATGENSAFGSRALAHVVLHNRVIHFTDLAVAREFSLMGLKAMAAVIYDPKLAVIYSALIDMIRVGFSAGWLTPELLYGTDASVFEVFKSRRAEFRAINLEVFERPYSVHACSEPAQADFHSVKSKVRYFDPPVLLNGKASALSQVDELYRKELAISLAAFERRKSGEYFRVVFSGA